MREEIKKEVQDAELNPDELDTVAGGSHYEIIDDDSGTIIPCCIHCGKWFSSVAELNEHLKKEHP